MKRIWIAIAFLTISIGLCVTEQIYLEKINTTICQYADSGDSDALVKYWKKNNDTLYIFSDHKILDDLSQAINEVEYTKDKKAALTEVKAVTKTYYENQRITFSNIF